MSKYVFEHAYHLITYELRGSLYRLTHMNTDSNDFYKVLTKI